jgi:predicted Zn-dependent peptidase
VTAKRLDPGLFQVREHALPNGLQVRLLESHAVPLVSYYTYFRVGSRNERPGITGISHLFEHMMFNGAKKYGPKEFDRRLEMQGGYSNAWTSNDFTAYHEDFPPGALELVVDLESDRMRDLAVTPESLKSEREVVKEERRFRTDNDIGGMLDEALYALAFKAHPYHWPVVGWMADLDAITREDCLDYFRTYYAPNNATLVVVGDFETERALGLIERAYAGIPRGPAPAEVRTAEPEQRGERRAVVRYPAQAPALMLGFHAPRAADRDAFALDVVQAALAVGESGRLRRKLVYEEELCVGVSVDYAWRIDPSLFVVYADVRPGVSPARAEAALVRELRAVAERGLRAAELERARAMLRASFLRELQTHNGRAHTMGQYEVLFGSWRAMLETPDRYEAVSAADARRVAEKTFAPSGINVVTLMPENGR